MSEHTIRERMQAQTAQQSVMSITDLIGMYIALSNIETPTTEKRNKILDNLENVILLFTQSFRPGDLPQ